MKTRVTELLNIEYPVIQGGMAWVADANLAAHVSKAGGMGFIGAANAPAEWVKEQIHIARKITDKPVGVNIMLLSDYADEIAQLVIDEHIEAVTTEARATEAAQQAADTTKSEPTTQMKVKDKDKSAAGKFFRGQRVP